MLRRWEALGETVNLAVLLNKQILYLDVLEGRLSMRTEVTVGSRSPIHCTALGKAIATGLPAAQVLTLLGPGQLPAYTPHTLTNPMDFVRALTAVRELGYATDDERLKPVPAAWPQRSREAKAPRRRRSASRDRGAPHSGGCAAGWHRATGGRARDRDSIRELRRPNRLTTCEHPGGLILGARLLFHELNRTELRERAARSLLVLPIGAVEQHGPHLPVGTDYFAVERVGRLAAERASANIPVLLAPTMPFGCSHHHLPWGGTISLSTEVCFRTVFDLVSSLVEGGFLRIFLLNGHGGNEQVLQLVARDVAQQRRAYFTAASYWALGKEALRATGAFESGWVAGHAGAFETALMLAIRPELVSTDLPHREHVGCTAITVGGRRSTATLTLLPSGPLPMGSAISRLSPTRWRQPSCSSTAEPKVRWQLLRFLRSLDRPVRVGDADELPLVALALEHSGDWLRFSVPPYYQRDVARARALLAEAGQANLNVEWKVVASNALDLQEAEPIKAQLAEADGQDQPDGGRRDPERLGNFVMTSVGVVWSLDPDVEAFARYVLAISVWQGVGDQRCDAGRLLRRGTRGYVRGRAPGRLSAGVATARTPSVPYRHLHLPALRWDLAWDFVKGYRPTVAGW